MERIASIGADFTSPPLKSPGQWRALHVFNGYRIALSLILLALHYFGLGFVGSTASESQFFWYAACAYCWFGCFNLIIAHKRLAHFDSLAIGQTVIDISLLTLLLHAGGGLGSGLGILINIAIAGNGILLSGRISLFFASVATLLLLAVQMLFVPDKIFTVEGSVQVGLLAASFFATAILAHVLSQRMRQSQALASERGIALANLAVLNEYVVQQLNSGVVVVNQAGKILLINQRAKDLLASENQQEYLGDFCPELAEKIAALPKNTSPLLPSVCSFGRVAARLHHLPMQGMPAYLIFLDDATETTQKAQQLKLASLGRFTASMAHELRNPLGAIGHASQLLAESTELPEEDRRLIEIINQQSQRMNVVIKNILQLSRRNRSQVEVIALSAWLANFIKDFKQQQLEAVEIVLNCPQPDIAVRFDPSQLQQVLTNLCENAVRYGQGGGRLGKLWVDVNGSPSQPYVFIDVCDQGAGVAEEQQQHLFEPFYTTSRTGIGLGLYVAKELCEANQASLSYLANQQGGACFRVTAESVSHSGELP